MPLASVTTTTSVAIPVESTGAAQELRIQNNSGEVVYYREAGRDVTAAGDADAGLVLPATMDYPLVISGAAARLGYSMMHAGAGTKKVAYDRSNTKGA